MEGSRYLPTGSQSTRSMWLTRSCSSPLASPSSPLSPKEAQAPIPSLRQSTKSRIDTEHPGYRLLHVTRIEDRRKHLEKLLNSPSEANTRKPMGPEEKIRYEKREKRKLSEEEDELNAAVRAPGVELCRQEHQLKVVVHTGGGSEHTIPHDTTYPGSLSETCIGGRTTVKTMNKRWSFCYGESDMLSLLPKISKTRSSRDDTRLEEPRHDKTKTRPS